MRNTRKDHWDRVYATRPPEELTWFQSTHEVSLRLIQASELNPGARVLDVGGGTSTLADRLLERDFSVTVLDVSEAALAEARHRLGDRAREVTWIQEDITCFDEHVPADLWHDRAVFHFLTSPVDRRAYRRAMDRCLSPGGHAIIASFAPDGPERCSGLDVVRYDGLSMSRELGEGYELLESVKEAHVTPRGGTQSFVYNRFRRTSESAR